MSKINSAFKSVFRMLIHTQTQMLALQLILQEQGTVTPENMNRALAQSREIWRPRLEAIESLDAEDTDTTLEAFLSSFQGPIQ